MAHLDDTLGDITQSLCAFVSRWVLVLVVLPRILTKEYKIINVIPYTLFVAVQ